ncbi:MAG TPA: hypothetical protein VNI83_04115 [Vicinamibacterales bacterium]|nr:hypothetical protein [Vicinamibacterales bacterium]
MSVVIDAVVEEPQPGLENPFVGWTHQCVEVVAVDAAGWLIEPQSPAAVAWCARGWLLRQGVPNATICRFSIWLTSQAGHTLELLNDCVRWTPDDFRRAWDEWVAAGQP